MKTKDQVLEAVKGGRASECLDGRDYARLIGWFAPDQWEVFGFAPKENATGPDLEWTREAFVEQMRKDVAFGFEKALDQRGISASFMFEVVKPWLWILEDDDCSGSGYAQYGLPLFRSVAVKYGFPNPIGDDHGDERKYGC